MDDEDDEIQSHPSPGSESPASPHPNGRITVTVATAPPQNNNNTLTLALPIQQQQLHQQQQQQQKNGGGREDCWSEGATAVLIDAWGERYLELSRGNLKQKHWKEVADIVSSREDYGKTPKTDIQCKNRIDTVKKKYKLEKAKLAGGGGPSKWPFFDRLDQLIGPSAKIPSGAAGTSAMVSSVIPKGVPMGIPVGVRSAHQFQKQQQKQKQFKRRAPVDSESSHSEPEPSPDSTDSLPPETYEPKMPRFQHREMNLSAVKPAVEFLGWKGKEKEKGKEKNSNSNSNWGNSVRELTRAILKFGEAYEHAESSKLQQLVEMEKQRMKFAKELELQRMQFFMKTQLELSQLKRRRGGNSTTGNNNHNSHNNSDSSN